ncbi:MAG: TlpA family protein disulfide reductase [Deltaproteobacteria bacterium]|nr:TlpA family protein disulfide reductase [Deltaproteobacteria bacterium]
MTRAASARALAASLTLSLLHGCVEAVPPPEEPTEPGAPATPSTPVEFELAGLDGGVVRASDLRGRLALVVVAATYDTASQAAVSMASAVVRRHRPRMNGLLVVLEPEANRPLVQAFVAALELSFGVALADAAALGEPSALGGIRHVPSFVLLDREGREVWRRVGLANVDVLEAAVREHDHP